MFKFVFPSLGVVALLAAAASAQTSSQPLSQLPTADTSANLGVPSDPVASSEEVVVPDEDEPTGPPDFYKIRPGDTLTISVLEDPNLTRTVLVRPDGRISLPIAGSVVVQGVSPENLEIILQERFARGFQITPTVTVAVRGLSRIPTGEGQDAVEPTVFYMMGSVVRPGPLQTVEELTLIEALAIAGGPNPFANKEKIQVRRKDEQGNETITIFDYTRLEDGLPLIGDIPIMDGDIIYVPERGLWD